MITIDVFNAMRNAGALQLDRFDLEQNLILKVNYKVVEEQFPRFLEDIVVFNLSPTDLELYNNGHIAYIVRDDGSLEWKPTRQLYAFMDKFMLQ
jgi:hypothetical protein